MNMEKKRKMQTGRQTDRDEDGETEKQTEKPRTSKIIKERKLKWML